jgi:hypothetical protein
MNKKAFSEKDFLKGITIIAGIALVYFLIKAVLSIIN